MTDRLFDLGEIPVSPRDDILAFDQRRVTNADRVIDLHLLGYLPEPILDPTFGYGAMWDRLHPRALVACDLDPGRARDVRCNFAALPFRDDAFASCLFDPPYKMSNAAGYVSPSGNHDELRVRFAVTDIRNGDVWRFIESGMVECFRVTTQFVTVKCQDMIHGGYQWQTGEVVNLARAHGWEIEDMLHLPNNISQPEGTAQHHSRRNYSTFVVLRPARRRRSNLTNGQHSD